MKELVFDDGIVSYSIRGVEVRFNPLDQGFAERFFNAIDAIRALEEEYENRGKNVKDEKDGFSIGRQIDDKMRKLLDDVFEEPVCDKIFGNLRLFAFSIKTGVPIWLNLVMTIIDEIYGSIDDVEKQADSRIAKYKAKYQKYAAKYHK